jgi:O-antigen/teichoic acid export membrane protein
MKILYATILYQVIISIFQIAIPRFVISTYGSAINGLSSSINQILLIVGLIQGGAVGASIYVLYKPVAEKDFTIISEVMYSSKTYFKKLGYIFCIVSIIVALVSSFILKNNDINQIEVILAFLLLILASAFSFFSFSYYDILFSSFQERYWLSIGNLIEKLIYYCLLIIVLYTRTYFLLMFAVVIFGTVSKVFFYTIIFKRKYKQLIDPAPKVKNYPIKNRGYLLLSLIADQAITYTPIVIVSFGYGLETASVYSVYAIIITAVSTLVNAIQLSMSALFGNLVATENDNTIKKVFNTIEYIFFLIGTYLTGSIAFLLMPFITLYTKGIDDTNYIYMTMAIIIPLLTAVFSLRTPYGFAVTVYGLFKDLCYISLFFSVLGIGIALALSLIIDMPFVLIGIIFYYFFTGIMFIFALRKKIQWINLKKISARIIIVILVLIISVVAIKVIPIAIDTITSWILSGILYTLVLGIALLVYSLIFEQKEMKDVIKYLKMFICKRIIK